MYIGTISSIGQMRFLRNSIAVVAPFRTGLYVKKQQFGYFFYLFAESIIKKYEILDSYGFDAAILLFLYNLHKEAEEHEKLKTCVEQTLRLLVLWNGQNAVENQIVCRQNVFLSNLKNEIELNLSFIRELNIHQYNLLNKLYSRESAQQNLLICKALISNWNSSENTPAGTSQFFEDIQFNKVTNPNFTNTIVDWKTMKPCSLSNSFRTILENVAYISHTASNRELFYSSVKKQLLTNFFTQHLTGGSSLQNRYSKYDANNAELIYNIFHTSPESTVLSNVNVDEINKYYSILSAEMSVFKTVEEKRKDQLKEYRQLSEDKRQIVNILSKVNYRELPVISSDLQSNIRKITDNILGSINIFATLNNIGQYLTGSSFLQNRYSKYEASSAELIYNIFHTSPEPTVLSNVNVDEINKYYSILSTEMSIFKTAEEKRKDQLKEYRQLSEDERQIANFLANVNYRELPAISSYLKSKIRSKITGNILSRINTFSTVNNIGHTNISRKETLSNISGFADLLQPAIPPRELVAEYEQALEYLRLHSLDDSGKISQHVTDYKLLSREILPFIRKKSFPENELFPTTENSRREEKVLIASALGFAVKTMANIHNSDNRFGNIPVLNRLIENVENNNYNFIKDQSNNISFLETLLNKVSNFPGSVDIEKLNNFAIIDQKALPGSRQTVNNVQTTGKLQSINSLTLRPYTAKFSKTSASTWLNVSLQTNKNPKIINLMLELNKHLSPNNLWSSPNRRQLSYLWPSSVVHEEYSHVGGTQKTILSPTLTGNLINGKFFNKNLLREKKFSSTGPAEEAPLGALQIFPPGRQECFTSPLRLKLLPILLRQKPAEINLFKKHAFQFVNSYIDTQQNQPGSTLPANLFLTKKYSQAFPGIKYIRTFSRKISIKTSPQSKITDLKNETLSNDAENNFPLTVISTRGNKNSVKERDFARAELLSSKTADSPAMGGQTALVRDVNAAKQDHATAEILYPNISIVKNIKKTAAGKFSGLTGKRELKGSRDSFTTRSRANPSAFQGGFIARDDNIAYFNSNVVNNGPESLILNNNNTAMAQNDMAMVQNGMAIAHNNMAMVHNDIAMVHTGMVFHNTTEAGKKEPQSSVFQTPSQSELISRFGNLIADPNLPPLEFSGRQAGSILSNSAPGDSADFSRKMFEKLTQEEQSNKEEQRRITELTQKLTEQETVIYKLQHAYAQLQEDMAKGINIKKITTLVMKELRDRLKLEKMRYGVQ